MEEIKTKKGGTILSILKSCLMGLVVTLIGTVIFAIVLKFADIPSKAISYVNNVIKALSLFVVVLILKNASADKLFMRSLFAGLIYGILSFIVFAILNGGFEFNASILFDLIFAVAVAVIVAIIFKLTSKKTA